MPKYTQLQTGLEDTGQVGTLVGLDWTSTLFSATFNLRDSDRILRVEFEDQTIVRVLDDMAISTDDSTEAEGIIPYGFAYKVDGADFLESQSPHWRDFVGPVSHYRFLTTEPCLDVISPVEPVFKID